MKICSELSISEAQKSHIPVDLIGRISSNTMHYGLVTTRMVLYPGIDAQNFAFIDYDVFAVGDESFDLAAGEDPFSELSHGSFRVDDR